jgi:hypothetical protein
MDIAERDEIQTDEERISRIQEEIIGRLLVVVFLLGLIVFSYFSFV